MRIYCSDTTWGLIVTPLAHAVQPGPFVIQEAKLAAPLGDRHLLGLHLEVLGCMGPPMLQPALE